MKPKAIGAAIDRVDARKKVTGTATYAADVQVANVAHAVIVTSSVTRGSVERIGVAMARKEPGVIAVLTSDNMPKVAAGSNEGGGSPQKRVLQLLGDDKLVYSDQPIAVVVADTLEHAQHAAWLVEPRYKSEAAIARMESALGDAYKPKTAGPHGDTDSARGNVDAGLGAAKFKIEQTYRTPVENHNPMEPHATIAVWQGSDHLTLYDATQGIFGCRDRLASLLGLDKANVRVVNHYVGGGFGCKGTPWSHVALCALAARAVGRPVKLAVTRQQMFSLVGHRPATIQTIALGCDETGKLTAVKHDVISETSRFDEFCEPSALQTRMLYSCPNVATTHRLVQIDIPTPTFMRAPGESTGTYALESAMDELAYAAGIDPLALRDRNYAERDEGENKEWSSKSLRECYKRAAERFGWARRSAKPRSMRDGDVMVGLGMATATYPTNQQPASARAQMRPDGTVLVQAGTQDIGTGTYTIMTQIAADTLGIPVEKVTFELGDTTFPQTPVSGGSMTAASTGSAVKRACLELKRKLDAGETNPIGEAKAEKSEEAKKMSSHAFGAVFAEVRVDEELGRIRVPRIVAAYAAGKFLNPKTARSQLIGGVVWALGLVLEENAVRDPRTARMVTRDLVDYHVPVNADIGEIDVLMVDEDDPYVNDIGVKGIGEIGITGASAAIANAVFHATGKRVRDLPISVEKIL